MSIMRWKATQVHHVYQEVGGGRGCIQMVWQSATVVIPDTQG